MARTLNDLVKEALGAQVLQILQLTAELEAVRAQLPPPPADAKAPDGVNATDRG